MHPSSVSGGAKKRGVVKKGKGEKDREGGVRGGLG